MSTPYTDPVVKVATVIIKEYYGSVVDIITEARPVDLGF